MDTVGQLLDRPAYSLAEASRLVSLRTGRVRRWLQGYTYQYESHAAHGTLLRRQGPIVKRAGTAESPFASFLDLVDLLFVKGFLDRHISLQRLRKALSEADEILGAHHFAQKRFFTDGRAIFLEIRQEGEAPALLELLTKGQWVIAPLILQLAEQIDFGHVSGFAERWFPTGRAGHIVLDPRIAFGAPAIRDRGIKTANIFDLYQAEKESVRAVCRWMDLTETQVKAAVDFETQLQAS